MTLSLPHSSLSVLYKSIEALPTSQNWSSWSRSFPSLSPSLSINSWRKTLLSPIIYQKENPLLCFPLFFSAKWGFQLGTRRFCYPSCSFTHFPCWVSSGASFCAFLPMWVSQISLRLTIFGPITRPERPSTRLYRLPWSGKSCLSSSSRTCSAEMVVVVTCRRVVLFVCMSLKERMRSGGWRIVSTFFTGLVWTVGWIMTGTRVHSVGLRLCLMRCRGSLISGYGPQIAMIVIFTMNRVLFRFLRELDEVVWWSVYIHGDLAIQPNKRIFFKKMFYSLGMNFCQYFILFILN